MRQIEYPETASTLDEIEQNHYTVVPVVSQREAIERVYKNSLEGSADRARSAYLMGSCFEQHDYVTAKVYFEEAYKIALKIADKKILSDTLHNNAYECLRVGKIKEFIRIESEVLNKAIECNHYFRIAFSNYMLGSVALMHDSHEIGLEYLKISLEIAERYGFLKLKIRVCSKLSELHLFSNSLLAAQRFAVQVVNIAREISSQVDLLNETTRLATVELELKKYGEVTKLVTEVRKTLPAENHSLWCVTHTLMGKVHEAKRRYDKAESEFRAALALADYVNAERVRSNVHTHLAELFLKTKSPKSALKEALAALADAEKAQDAFVRKEALRCVHDCYKALGKYKEAHEYLEKYNTLVAESDAALLKSRLEYHALKSDFEQEKLKSETHAKKSELLRIKLEYKERELTEKMRHLIKQAEAVRQFRNDLRSLIRRTPADDPSIKDIRTRLSSFPESEVNWDEFEKEFREVHPEFLQTLLEKCPELTKMEQRIAAMVRMDLKSVDISRLFSITERAVEFHRLNLRKKLRLKRNEQLPKYLATL